MFVVISYKRKTSAKGFLQVVKHFLIPVYLKVCMNKNDKKKILFLMHSTYQLISVLNHKKGLLLI